ncbi:MAG: phosphate signaling complex PhoU family protein [Chloroflexota bacterium]
MNHHLLKKFDDELTKLRFRLIKMGALVQQQVEYSMRSILENNEEIANLVLELEVKVNKLDIKIDKQCLRIFALHQPVAMDLRHVLSAVTINNNLEMLGDMAALISKNYAHIKFSPELISETQITDIADRLNLIIADVMDAFTNLSGERALTAIYNHKEISVLTDRNLESVIKLMKTSPSFVEQGGFLIDINRSIQNISVYAKSIAEELIFLIEARMIRHKDIWAEDSGEEDIK